MYAKWIGVTGTIYLVLLSGCIRFTPSREALGTAQQGASGDEQDFDSFEKRLRAEKDRFLDERRTAAAQAQRIPTYTLGTGDLVDVQVFGFPDLSARARVRPTGTISLPLVEELPVEGLTEDELQGVLARRLKPYVRQPNVKVSIEDYRAHKVSIIGAVTRPGEYPLRRSDYTLLDLLSEAGGRLQESGRRIVVVPAERRRFELEEGSVEPRPAGSGGVEFDIEEFYGDVGRPPIVLPLLSGDTVVVPEAGTFTVLGDVKHPGTFPLRSRTSVLGAVAAAGGLEYSADVQRVELIRTVGAEKQAAVTFDLDELAVKRGNDMSLRNGDVVRVPSTGGRFVQRQLVEFLNGLLNFGYSAS